MKNKKFIKTSFGCVILIISIFTFAISCSDVPNEPSDDDNSSIIGKDKIDVIIDTPSLESVSWRPGQDTLHIENGFAKNENILAFVVKGASVNYKSVFEGINVSVNNIEPAVLPSGVKSVEVDKNSSTIPEGDIDTTGGIIKAVIKLTAKEGKTFEGGGNTYSCTITVNAKQENSGTSTALSGKFHLKGNKYGEKSLWLTKGDYEYTIVFEWNDGISDDIVEQPDTSKPATVTTRANFVQDTFASGGTYSTYKVVADAIKKHFGYENEKLPGEGSFPVPTPVGVFMEGFYFKEATVTTATPDKEIRPNEDVILIVSNIKKGDANGEKAQDLQITIDIYEK